MTHHPIVGLIGRKRVGKDAFAAVLVAEHSFRRLSFADPLRAAALALDPLIGPCALPGDLHPSDELRLSDAVRTLGWEGAKDLIPEVRRILQRLGTDAIRSLDDGFWVRQAMASLEQLDAPAVFTDVRFPNEADAIRERGGILVRIVRPGARDAADTHASETALDGYRDDRLILNIESLADLQDMARTFAGDLKA